MHQALYRKWRPKTFTEVCGQEHITSILQYEVDSHTTTHAYLFCGSRGTGKTSCAKILAKAVNCLNPKDGNPCGVCEACHAIDNGTATDVLEMDAASNTGVDYIRDIREEVAYTPAMLKTRVYIIDEVHMLSGSAFNALLKTLEEPPSQVIFILATTELQKIPATVLSRCKRFDFCRISNRVIADRLLYIAKEEKIDLTEEAAFAIAKLSQGGMRDAISLLELCAGKAEKITYETVMERAGAGGRQSVYRVMDAILDKNFEAIFAEMNALYHSSKDVSVFFSELLCAYRDLMVVKHSKNPKEYLDITDSELDTLHNYAEQFSTTTLLYHSNQLDTALQTMQRGASQKQLYAEMALLRLCDEHLSDSADALLSRVEALEDTMLLGSFTQKAQEKEALHPQPMPQKTVKQATQEAKISTNEEVPPQKSAPKAPVGPKKSITEWREIVQVVMRANPAAASFLNDMRAVSAPSENRIYLYANNAFQKTYVENLALREMLANILRQKLKAEWITAQSIVVVLQDNTAQIEDDGLNDLRADMNQ